MDFIINNADIFIALGVTIVVVGFGFFLIPYLKEKGYIKKEDAESTKEILQLLKMLVTILKVEEDGQDDKKRVLVVFEIAKEAVRYVEQSMALKDATRVKQEAINTVIEMLETAEIEVTEDLKKLIEEAVDMAVERLHTNK